MPDRTALLPAGPALAELGPEAIIEALEEPLLLVDAGRRLAHANGAARALFGSRGAGRDLAATLREPGLLDAVDAVLEGEAFAQLVFTLTVPVERVMRAQVKRLPAPTGPAAALVTLHDITASAKAEQMRVDFIANASHELRTPLSSLIGFVETLQGPAKGDAEATQRFLRIVHEQALRMSRLVEDLMSLSRIELDEHTAPRGHVAVAALCRSALASFEIKAADREIALHLGVAEDVGFIDGDADQLQQVLQNLIDNAIKYGRPGGSVTLSAQRNEGETVTIQVADDGIGIARTHLPRLTERFYRVDPARSKQVGGTGLGLAIVKHVVNRHRGRLNIASTSGKGTEIALVLPVRQNMPRA